MSLSSSLALPAAETAILVIDCQNDMAHPDGVSARMQSSLPGRVAERNIFERINHVTEEARARGIPVIFVRHAYRADYADAPPSGFGAMVREQKFCANGGWGAEIVDALAVCDQDVVITKNRESAFFGTGLEAILDARGVTRLVLAGIATDGAVEGSAREAQDRDIMTVIVADCCVGSTDEAHRASTSGLMAIMGIVCPAVDVVNAFRAGN